MEFKIKQLRKKAGLTQVAVVKQAGISQPYLSQLENGTGGRTPSLETLNDIARALSVSPSSLIDGEVTLPVSGRVGAGAKVNIEGISDNPNGLYRISCPDHLYPKRNTVVAVEVIGDSMLPNYQENDILFYEQQFTGVPSEAVGRICICQDDGDNVWVKWVKQGETADTFNLISTNPMIDNRLNVRLKWASPVLLHYPAEFVERV